MFRVYGIRVHGIRVLGFMGAGAFGRGAREQGGLACARVGRSSGPELGHPGGIGPLPRGHTKGTIRTDTADEGALLQSKRVQGASAKEKGSCARVGGSMGPKLGQHRGSSQDCNGSAHNQGHTRGTTRTDAADEGALLQSRRVQGGSATEEGSCAVVGCAGVSRRMGPELGQHREAGLSTGTSRYTIKDTQRAPHGQMLPTRAYCSSLTRCSLVHRALCVAERASSWAAS